MSTDEYGVSGGWNRQTGVCGVAVPDINMRAPVTLVRVGPCRFVFVRVGRWFFCRSPACATALPTRPFADFHPPHQDAGTGNACPTGLTSRWCFCRSSCMCVSAPKPFRVFRVFRGFIKKGAFVRDSAARIRDSAISSFIFHLSSLIIPLRARANKKNAKNAVFLRNRLENLADAMYF